MLSSCLRLRRHTRYTADSGNIVNLEIRDKDFEDRSLKALVIDSSFGGLRVLLFSANIPKPEREIVVKFDRYATFKGRIVWMERIDDYIFKLGIQYLTPS